MTPVEIIAAIIIILSAVKILVLLVSPKSWMNFSKKIFASKGLVQVVALVLAGVVLYYLLQEISIVQIFAVIAFTALLFVLGLVNYINAIYKIADKAIRSGRLWKDNLLYALIWIILLVWAAKELFF